MLQRCRFAAHTPSTAPATDRGDPLRDPPLPSSSTARPVSECEWKPFDLVRKRSGPRNLSRSGYDEEKCRNVLVRFCAHVPRNFQYKDGIQQIFLILREYLGDENLDLAGGVLYELIEVDCEHTDDPGAAFQRWRHDHMYRYADLELPHIPHMTTITTSIIPTEALSRWRAEHPERYRFVLSDSSPLPNRDYADPSCVRSKKTWLIDHTLFVSTRSDGTRPMRSPNPKEFHEMQWDSEYGGTGRLVDQREFPITSLDRPSDASQPDTADTSVGPASRSQRLRHSLSSISIIEKLIEKIGKQKREHEIEQRRRSWAPNTLTLDSRLLPKDKSTQHETVSVPWPEGCQIPNAIFARKFLIVDNSEALPSHLPISQMPTAESKATETIVQAATTGLLNQSSQWLFRGPFTPQLGFDGGLDYQWNPKDPGIIVRRFDFESPLPDTLKFNLDGSPGDIISVYGRHIEGQQLLSKRRGRLFAIASTADVKDCALAYNSFSEASSSGVGDTVLPRGHLTSLQYIPACEAPDATRKLASQRSVQVYIQHKHSRDLQLFNNIEFTIQTGDYDTCTPVTNRQTTVVERSGESAAGS
ncbi:hypothetical protein F5Y14DRAFT_459987 [Nemania sp. NC0429]|nr:hypothetical protein F5Y14DRAFT_459987 [Nemania sp. NC0429]